MNIKNLVEKYNNAANFFNHANELGYIYPKFEISSPVAKLNYDSFIELLKVANPKENKNYKHIPFDTVALTSFEMMEDIFGDTIPITEYDNIYYMLGVNHGPDPFECNYIELNGKKIFAFDRLDTLDSIPCVGHESTHYLQDKYTLLLNGFHCEIMSMLVELIMVYELNKTNIDKYLLSRNINKTIKALQDLLKFIDESKELETEILSIPEYKPRTDLIKLHAEYMAYTYISSFIYAYNLFLRYKDDKKELLTNLRKVFSMCTSADMLISIYGIDFKDNKTFDNVITLIK